MQLISYMCWSIISIQIRNILLNGIDYIYSNKKENFACQNQNCKCENLKEKNREEHTKIYVG
jgi:hypothetical protein